MAVAKLQALSAPAVRGLGELKVCGQTWGVSAAVGCGVPGSGSFADPACSLSAPGEAAGNRSGSAFWEKGVHPLKKPKDHNS